LSIDFVGNNAVIRLSALWWVDKVDTLGNVLLEFRNGSSYETLFKIRDGTNFVDLANTLRLDNICILVVE
jgi:hypothetical protein